MISSQPKTQPLLLGHRGTRVHAPENTITAFDLCLEHGCDGFELDVRRTSDGNIIVVHDPDVNGVVVAESKSTALRQASKEPIPLLDDILSRYQKTAYINVEMKVTGTATEIASMIWRTPPWKGVLVSSFLPAAIEEFHQALPDVLTGFICRDPNLLPLWKTLPITHAVLCAPLVTPELVQEVHDAGKQVFIWTPNTEPEIRSALALSVDGIISDDSRILCQTARI